MDSEVRRSDLGVCPKCGMGTRSGDLDPGILLYLMNEKGYASRRLERLVNHKAGLLGVSGLTSDMKTLIEKRGSEPNTAQAMEMFCYQIRKHIGAMGGLPGS